MGISRCNTPGQYTMPDETPNEAKVIFPPNEIKEIVYKTAWYTLNKGSDFEKMLREKEANNYRFSFLNPNDPYYSFYQKIKGELLIGQNQTILNENPIKTEVKGVHKSNLPTLTKSKLSRVDFDYSLLDSIVEVSRAANKSNPYYDFYLQSCLQRSSFTATYEKLLLKALDLRHSSEAQNNYKAIPCEGWIYPKILDYVDFHNVSKEDFVMPKTKLDFIMMSAKDRELYYNNARSDQFLPPEA